MEEDKKNRILAFAENHPYILVAVITSLIIIIIMMYISSRGWGMESLRGKKAQRKKKSPLGDEEEMDDLIDAIHAKQRRKK